MEIEKTKDVKPYGCKGYVVINDQNLSIVKELEKEKKYILQDNLSRIYYLDMQKKIFEMILD